MNKCGNRYHSMFQQMVARQKHKSATRLCTYNHLKITKLSASAFFYKKEDK